MSRPTSPDVPQLLRRLREEEGCTQAELAERVGTTQSVISRLESDHYEGHSLSILFRIGAALGREIVVTTREDRDHLSSVREPDAAYATSQRRGDSGGALSKAGVERLLDRLAEQLADRGVPRAELEAAVLWARDADASDSLARLRGCLAVGGGDVLMDVRNARARRGSESP